MVQIRATQQMKTKYSEYEQRRCGLLMISQQEVVFQGGVDRVTKYALLVMKTHHPRGSSKKQLNLVIVVSCQLITVGVVTLTLMFAQSESFFHIGSIPQTLWINCDVSGLLFFDNQYQNHYRKCALSLHARYTMPYYRISSTDNKSGYQHRHVQQLASRNC